MGLELPEGGHVDDRVVPRVLAGSVAGASRLEVDEVPNRAVHLGIRHLARTRDDVEGLVGVIVVGDDGARGLGVLFLHGGLELGLVLLVVVPEQLPGLKHLLLEDVLGQGVDEVVGGRGVETRLGRVQGGAGEADVEMTPECAVILDLLGHLDGGVIGTLVAVVSNSELLLLQHDPVLGDVLERSGQDGGRDGDDDVHHTVIGPDGHDVLGDVIVDGALVEPFGAKMVRGDVARDGSDLDRVALGVGHRIGGLRLGRELLHGELHEQVHTHDLGNLHEHGLLRTDTSRSAFEIMRQAPPEAKGGKLSRRAASPRLRNHATLETTLITTRLVAISGFNRRKRGKAKSHWTVA